MSTHNASCFCGAVKFTVSGEAAGAGYCHCQSCRDWTAAPVNGFTLWPADAVQVTAGRELIDTTKRTEVSHRNFCTKCGGHVFVDHPGFGLVDIPAALIPDFDFQPGLHVHYQETVLPLRDGLPKFKDFPTDFGGSGEELPE
ncbi:MAG: GFA family protein [Salinisphaera sp.]|nr:GFA family protein [Salinisphaera sp.]